MAIVTRAVRQKQAEEAYERCHPEVALARQEQAAAWEGMRAEIKRLWPSATADNLDAIEEYRNRRAREIEDAIRAKYP